MDYWAAMQTAQKRQSSYRQKLGSSVVKKDFESGNIRNGGGGGGGDHAGMSIAMEKVEKLATENAVVVFSKSGCCMCHVVKRLFSSLGVSPTVYELDDPEQQSDATAAGGAAAAAEDVEKALLMRLVQQQLGREYDDHDQSLLQLQAAAVPSVYVGGNLLGGLDHVMAAHINGTLVPQLKEAGALWL